MNRQSGDSHWTRQYPERVRRGAAGNGARLTDEQIEEIIYLHTQCGSPQTWLAQRYGVSRVTVWRHIKASRVTQ